MDHVAASDSKSDLSSRRSARSVSPFGVAKVLLVFFASYVVLLVVFSQFGFLYFKLFAGIFRLEIDTLYHPLKVASLRMETYSGQEMISLEARMTENVILDDGVVLHSRGRPYIAKTLSIGQYLHPILILSILAAWPAMVLRDRFKVLLLVLPFLLVVEMIDIPILLATRTQEMMRIDLYNDLGVTSSLGSFWAACMHSGGREALSLLAIGLALGCFYLGRFRRGRKVVARAATVKRNRPAR